MQQPPVLRPPGSHQDPQQPGLIAPQEPINNYQNYKGLNAPSNLHIPLGSSQDQSIKNSFPSNAPHTIKFSISSQNYNPNQVKHSLNPGTPPPKLNSRVTPNLVQGRFTSGIQTSQNRPTNNQVPNVNYHQQTSHFNNPPKGEQTSFQNFNIKTKATFNLPPVSSGPDLSTQYNLNGDQSNFNFRAQQSNEISSVSLNNKGPQASEVNHNAGFRPADSQTQAKFPQSSLIQSSVELQHDDLLQQRKFNQHQTIQSNFGFPKISPHQSNLQSTSQPIYEFNPTEQQPKFGQQPVENNFERRTTEAPSTIQNEAFGHQDSIKVSTAVPSAKTISSDTNGRNLVYHKSQDHLQLALHGNFLSNHNSNEISSSPNPIAEETFTTVTTAFEKPKPVVKEITINLNDQGISNDGLSPQLFIKEDRQKEFQEIKSKEQRRRKEKSQEELINEQIQKLLQNHNLEVLRKDGESQRNLQEVQLPAKISEQFKNENYSVQVLGGGGLISEVKQKQKIETTLPPLPELPDHIKKQYEIKLINKDELLKQYDLPKDQDLGNDSSRVFLANGQQLEIVKFSKDGIMDKIPVGTKTILQQPTTTVKPIKAFFEELTKEVIPPGANFELIKHKEDGRVEKVDGFTDGKKVTFVFLEEQPDGSVKIQGVKGNTNQEAEGNEVVDSLIKKIKNGSLKLPPSQKSEGKSLYPNEISRVGSAAERIVATSPKPVTAATVGPKSIQSLPPSAVSYPKENSFNRELTTEYTHSSPYSLNLDAKLSSPLFYQTTPEPPTTFLPTLNYIRPSTRKSLEIKSNFDFLPTVPTDDGVYTPTFGSRRLKPTTSSWFKNGEEARNTQESSTENLFLRQEGSHYGNPEILSHRSSEYAGQRLRVPQDVIAEETNINAFRPLNEVLKENKLNEMAKFLEQSGLTAILNETGKTFYNFL